MAASETTSVAVSPIDDPPSVPPLTVAAPEMGQSAAPPIPVMTKEKTAARWNLALAFGALVLALVGQFFFTNIRDDLKDGGLFFAGAIALLLILAWQREPHGSFSVRTRFSRIVENIRGQPIRTALILASVVLIYMTMRLSNAKPGNDSYWDVFTLWVLSGVCYGAAFIPLPRFGAPRLWLRRNQREVLLVVGLTLVAAGLRFWQLGALPDVVSGDEGIIGTLIMGVLKGQFNNMLVTFNNQGVLYLYILAGAVKLFGQNPLGLRVVAAVAGTLTAPFLYILTRRMFSFRVAVLATSLLVVSHFHVHISRIIAASSIYDALFAVVVFYLFLVGLEKRSLAYLALGGLMLGLFLYIYMGARLLVLVIPAYVAALWFVDRQLARDNLGGLLAFAGALAVVATPISAWAIANPNEFMSRANQMGVIQSGWLANEVATTGQNQFVILADLLRQAFLTVNYFPAVVHYGSEYPMLDFVSGALFMLGIAYSLYRVFDRRHLLLQAWFWSGMVVGGALVIVPSDNAYRIAIVFPAVCIFVALGVDRLVALGVDQLAAFRVDRLAALGSRGARPDLRWTIIAPVIAFLTVATVLNVKAYFPDFAFTCRFGDWATRFASHMGQTMADVGPSYTAYLVGDGRVWHGIHKSVDYLSNDRPLTNVAGMDSSSGQLVITEPEGPLVTMENNRPTIIFFIPERAGEMGAIRSYLPGGVEYYIPDCGVPMVGVYRVNQLVSQ